MASGTILRPCTGGDCGFLHAVVVLGRPSVRDASSLFPLCGCVPVVNLLINHRDGGRRVSPQIPSYGNTAYTLLLELLLGLLLSRQARDERTPCGSLISIRLARFGSLGPPSRSVPSRLGFKTTQLPNPTLGSGTSHQWGLYKYLYKISGSLCLGHEYADMGR